MISSIWANWVDWSSSPPLMQELFSPISLDQVDKKNLLTSTLVFNISQFFPLLNHHLLTKIIQKVGLNSCVIEFFNNYFIDRKTNFLWNNFPSHIFDGNVGVGQGLALSPILSVLYLSPFLYILEKCLKNLQIPISIIFFVDDGLFISQDKSLKMSNCQDCWQWTLFYFSFLSFLFLFLEQLGLGLIGHAVTSVTSWWQSHKTNHKTWENLVEDSRTNDIIQHGHHMLTSWTTHGCLG